MFYNTFVTTRDDVAERPGRSSAYSPVRYLAVDAEHAGRRIDNFLGTQLKSLPTARLYSMLRRGEVRVGGRRVKPTYRLSEHDVLRLPPIYSVPRNSARFAKAVLEDVVLYEDADVMVLDKPSGVAVHGGSGLSFGLVESMRAARTDLDYLELAHRLDKDTSGCLLLAKSRSMLRTLHAVFRENSAVKRYLALVCGRVRDSSMLISASLLTKDRSPGTRVARTVVSPGSGRDASTAIKLIARVRIAERPYTLVEAVPRTGRMHQIRAHLAYSGHPVTGDEKYGLDEDNVSLRRCGLKRLFLHAQQLTVPVPELGQSTWQAPLPTDLSHFLERHAPGWERAAATG